MWHDLRHRTAMTFRIPTTLLLLYPGLCLAQTSVDAGCLADPTTEIALDISDAMSSQFESIRQCIDDEDSACAEQRLEAIDDDELTDDELAVFWLSRGDYEYLDGSSRRARREYRRVIRQRDVNRQLVATAVERTAIRHIEDDNHDDAANVLAFLECGDWTPELAYLRARAHFGEGEFAEAESTMQVALVAREAIDDFVPDVWYSFAEASERRARQAANAAVVCKNEKRTGSNIPVRVCSTGAQRHSEASTSDDILIYHPSIILESIE